MPACTKLSPDTNMTEVLAYLWATPGHKCLMYDVRENVREALLELGHVEQRGELLVLTDKGLRSGKVWHDKEPEPPYWMLDTTPEEDGGTGLFHAFDDYVSALQQKPVLCGIQLKMATDHVMAGEERQKCPTCRAEEKKRAAP